MPLGGLPAGLIVLVLLTRQQPGEREPAREEAQPPTPLPPPLGLLPLQVVAEIDPRAASIGNGKKPRPNAPALLDQARLVFTTDSGEAFCFNAETGAPLWSRSLPGAPLLPPSSAPSGFLLAAKDGRLVAVEGEQGSVLFDWATDFPLALAPLSHGSVVYLAGPEGEVGAFEPEQKRFLWRATTGEAVRALGFGAGLLVASGDKGTLTALSAKEGEVRWTFHGEGRFEAPAVFDLGEESLFIGDASGAFYSLSTDRGKLRYRWRTGAAISVPALVLGKRVYVASHAGTLFAYTEGGGHEQWRADLPGRPASGPVAAGPFVALATLNGEIVEFNASSARRGGASYRAPGDIRTPPTLAPPRAVVVLRSGKLLLLVSGHPPVPQAPTERVLGLSGEARASERGGAISSRDGALREEPSEH